jgi:hypothetical protein
VKLLPKAILLSILAAILVACSAVTPKPPNLSETPVPTATVLPSSTLTPRPSATPTPIPTLLPTPTPETPTPIPTWPTLTASPTLPDSVTRTTVVMDNGLTWTECAVPDREYNRGSENIVFLSKCAAIPVWNAEDESRMGKRIEIGSGFSDFQIILGNDLFEAKLDIPGCCQYDLLKNGKVLLHAAPGFSAYDPNISLWNLEGKYVWELSGWWSGIFVDGVDLNQKYQLEESYYSYEIKGKLIYVAKKNGQYHIMYDNKVIGPEFDEISMPHCCGMLPLLKGGGQYWFAGRRGGTKYIVSIH